MSDEPVDVPFEPRVRFEIMPPETIDVGSDGLKLRPFRPEDAKGLFELASAPEVARFVPWATPIHSPQDASRTVERFIETRQQGTFARYVLDKDAEFVGYIGIWPDKPSGYFEFGFAILPRFQSQGFGTKVLRAIREVAESHLGARGLVAHVNDENKPSQAVVAKMGFTRTEEFDKGDRRYELNFR